MKSCGLSEDIEKNVERKELSHTAAYADRLRRAKEHTGIAENRRR
jgi:hypothetical protein